MKVAGFTIVRNAIKFDYPAREAIESILPVCDRVFVAVGDSDDETLELIQSINSEKVTVIHTTWDMNLREGGKVLAVETNKAFDAIPGEFDWCFYIQADEVMHEKYIEPVKKAMLSFWSEPDVQGLLFKYRHFYGSYDYVGSSRRWYRREVRIIRNDKKIRSYKDAQGFRRENKKLRVKLIDAEMYHYGWVKPPEKQQEKQKHFNKFWHSDEKVKEMVGRADTFDYSEIDLLTKFEGTHPKVMKNRIAEKNWTFDYDISKANMSLKDQLLYRVEKWTNLRIGEYKNYKLI